MSAILDVETTKHRLLHGLVPREDFPVPEGAIYLNAAGIGLVPAPVQRRLVDFLRALGSGGTASYFQYYEELMMGAQRAAAALWNAPIGNVAVGTSVSEVISQVACWRRPLAGENVVMLADDCSAATYPWLRSARDTGAEMRFARPAEGALTVEFEDIARLVDDRTAAISVSHVHWISGLKLDLQRLGELARAYGAWLIVDATHSGGVAPFAESDLAAADLLVTGSFKWLCGYAGAAPLYASDRLLAEFDPMLVGSRTSHPAPPFDEIDATRMSPADDARMFEYGSSITLPRMAMAGAIDYLHGVGFAVIRDHVTALGDLLAERMSAIGAQMVAPLDKKQRLGIFSVRFPDRDNAAIYAALLGEKVSLSLRAGVLRFSPHLYNCADDIEHLANVARRIGLG